MISRLKNGKKVVGLKQTRKALNAGTAVAVFLAIDADPAVTGPLEQLCAEKAVSVDNTFTMRELGQACGITVRAAAAAVLEG